MIGPTEYAPEVAELVSATGAQAVFLLVIGGPRGGGVSAECPAHLLPYLAENLRAVAAQVEADHAAYVSRMGS